LAMLMLSGLCLRFGSSDCGLLCADFDNNKKSSTPNQKITQVLVCVSITRPRHN
jgi:hypothetical protein